MESLHLGVYTIVIFALHPTIVASRAGMVRLLLIQAVLLLHFEIRLHSGGADDKYIIAKKTQLRLVG